MIEHEIIRGLAMNKLNRLRRLPVSVAAILILWLPALAQQNFRTLVSFAGSDGANPPAPLVQGLDGDLYGTTYAGGANSGGTVFKMTTQGALTTLHSFCAQANCADGQGPNGALFLASNGNFYGTTLIGGAADSGTVFEITPAGSFTSLYSFCTQPSCSDGKRPFAGLIEASDGNLYGTTVFGGSYNQGTVFRITTAGAFTVMHSFQGVDGAEPYGGVIQATDGNFYGTTYYGGAYNSGAVFKMTSSGAFKTLYSFCSQTNCEDGAQPYAALVETTSGRLYGTTERNGAHANGTAFEITPAGTLTTLYSFCSQPSCADGGYPHAALIQAADASLYGTTDRGGSNGYGTIFKLSGGTLATLGSFQGTNGTEPDGLVQATNGVLYGTTLEGGTNSLCPYDYGCGIIFSLSLGLAEFVETLPTPGTVGATVHILGTNLTGSTSVSFNGVAALFSVDSPTEITATVPSGATTGAVQVTTPHGALSSNVPFRVIP